MEDNLYFRDYDYSAYDGVEPPFVVRHTDGSAQVVIDRDEEGRPIRIPGFLVASALVRLMQDQEIINLGLQHLGNVQINTSPTGTSEN
jgi:hypothetical protein